MKRDRLFSSGVERAKWDHSKRSFLFPLQVSDILAPVMKVTVTLVGTLRKYSLPETPGEWKGQIAEGSCVADLAQRIGIPDSVVKLSTIDDSMAKLDTPLKDGARVLFFPPISGG